jgi:hypothetical protein
MSKTHWYYDHDGHVGGPITVSELRQLAASGELLPTDRVRKEGMERWVKARAVKGLFAPPASAAEIPRAPEPADGDTIFDFFGAWPPAPAAEPEAAPTESFNPAFDFFGGQSQSATSQPAEIEMYSVAPAPSRKSTPPRKRPTSPELPPVAPESFPADAGAFHLTAPVDNPVPYAGFLADVPMAVPIMDDEVSFAADVPMATPASEIGMTPPVTELTGPEIALQPDGTATPTGGTVTLSVSGRWLAARVGDQETYLRLDRLDVVALRERSGVGLVLSVHAGGQSVEVRCDRDADAARAFLRRVLEVAG